MTYSPSDPRPRITTTKRVNLSQLAEEMGGAGLCRNETTGEIVGNAPVTSEQLEAAVAAHVPKPVPYAPLSIAHANSGDRGERVSALPINPTAAKVVLSVPVGDVLAGDLFMVSGEMQVTNPHAYNCLATGLLVLATTPDGVTGAEVTEANGTNVTPGMHHMAITKAGSHLAASALGVRYANLVARAAADQSQPGDALAVDLDYGRLSVVRIRGAEPLTT